jgi:Tol biopolymer transport system component
MVCVSINGKAETRMMRFADGTWSSPQVILSHNQFSYNDPFLSPDQSKLFFISDRPLDSAGQKKDYDIWYVLREGTGWSQPINAGSNINSGKNEYYISFTDDGTMYFSSNEGTTGGDDYDIYTSKSVNGEFLPRIKLGDPINTVHYEADVFVAPDESYVIFCSMRPGGIGRGDLYISFKGTDGNWMTAKNMGGDINKEKTDYCPFVSPDGKYFFYTSQLDIHWVDTSIIEELR